MDTLLIDQSLRNYQHIAATMKEIDKAIQGRNSTLILTLHQELNTLFESAKATDALILDMVRKEPQSKGDDRLNNLLSLMQTVRRANKKMRAQLHSILAVQREELHKMKKGNTLLQGYRPATVHTGKKISISN